MSATFWRVVFIANDIYTRITFAGIFSLSPAFRLPPSHQESLFIFTFVSYFCHQLELVFNASAEIR